MARRADVSLLFDLFVTSQRVRRVLTDGLAGSGMRPDEYAVYSLLFDHGPLTATEMSQLLGMPLTTALDYLRAVSAAGHLDRIPHPTDGRAFQLRLSRAGMAAQQRANARWEVVRKRIEESLSMPIAQIRLALQALDDAADRAAGPRPQRRVPIKRAGPANSVLSSARKPTGRRGIVRRRRRSSPPPPSRRVRPRRSRERL